MVHRVKWMAGGMVVLGLAISVSAAEKEAQPVIKKMVKSEKEWEVCLTPEQYQVLRKKGTERAFTGEYYDFHEEGVYLCAACGNELFGSKEKFDSGTGWPSYFAPVGPGAVVEEPDNSLGMRRVEVNCANCGSHLGHVFDDGPAPTHKRFCINSAALNFKKKKQ